MCLGERLAGQLPLVFVGQSNEDVSAFARNVGRAQGIVFAVCRLRADSAASIGRRIVDSIVFALWVCVSLVKWRPQLVYVATDPPVIVPLVVSIYCRLFAARYLYHLQDIHPETSRVTTKINRYVFSLLRSIDVYTLRHAGKVVTISSQMARELEARVGHELAISLVNNPALSDDKAMVDSAKSGDIIFCGNAGRLQRIPLIVQALDAYIGAGGRLKFTFVGGGLFASMLRDLSVRYDSVRYLGVVSAEDAARLMSCHKWGLMPIDDEVTRYAFPSKSSSYVMSGSAIIAVCSASNAVAKWVEENGIGLVSTPEVSSIVELLKNIEDGYFVAEDYREALREMRNEFSIDSFLDRLSYEILSLRNVA